MLQIPNGLYSGGDVRLDSTPYMRIAESRRARQQAINEATYRHYSELPDKLNSAGVRAQDWEDPNGNGGIGQDIENTKSYFIQNSKDIMKGGQAAVNYNRMMQNNMRKIQASKDIAKEELIPGKEMLKPNGWKARHSDIPVIDKMSLSLYDPKANKEDGSRYGLHDLSMAAAPYNDNVELGHNKVISNGIVPDRIPNDKGVFDERSQKVTYNYAYSPEKLKQIGTNAANDASSNKTLNYHYEDLMDNPEAVKKATEAGQSVFGKDFIADTPEKMAAGTKIAEYSQMKIPKPFTDLKSIQEYKTNERLAKEAFTSKEKEKDRISREKNADKLAKAGIDITDPMAYMKNAPEVTIPQQAFDPSKITLFKDAKSLTFVPFPDNMSEDDISFIAGGKDNYNNRKQLKTSYYGGKEGLYKDENGVFYDDNKKPIDPNRGIINKIQKQSASLDKQLKGKVNVIGETKLTTNSLNASDWLKSKK